MKYPSTLQNKKVIKVEIVALHQKYDRYNAIIFTLRVINLQRIFSFYDDPCKTFYSIWRISKIITKKPFRDTFRFVHWINYLLARGVL